MSARAAARLRLLGFEHVFRYTAGKVDWFASGLPREGRSVNRPRTGDAARPDVPTCRTDEWRGEVARRVRAAGWHLCVVVDEDDVVLGVLEAGAGDRETAMLVEAAMRADPTTIRPHVLLQDAVRWLRDHKRDHVLITTSDGRLVGLLQVDEALLTHELTHVVQHSLAQGRRDRGERWLREGMADWVAARVLDHLGEESAGDVRRRALDAVADSLLAVRRAGSGHGNDRVRHLRLGGRRAYALSFLLVDELVRRHEVRALMAYFSLAGPGYRWRFAHVFGEAPEAFIGKALERLTAEAATAEGRLPQVDSRVETADSRGARC